MLRDLYDDATPTVRCRECGWTGQGDDVVQDVHLYCHKCGGVKLTEKPATNGEGDERTHL